MGLSQLGIESMRVCGSLCISVWQRQRLPESHMDWEGETWTS